MEAIVELGAIDADVPSQETVDGSVYFTFESLGVVASFRKLPICLL